MSLLTSKDGVKNKVREIAPKILKDLHAKLVESEKLPEGTYTTMEIAFTKEGGVLIYPRIYDGENSRPGQVHDINEFIDLMPSSFSEMLK